MKNHHIIILACAACLCGLPAADAQLGEEGLIRTVRGGPYYSPMTYTQTVTPAFPSKVLQLGLMSGEAAVAVQIDAEGRLTDYIVAAYSHPAFADEAVAAIKHWKFNPARIRGIPVSSTADLTFKFKTGGAVVDETVFTITELIRYKIAPDASSFSVDSLGQLDRTPTPTKIVKPTYTPAQARHTKESHVTVQFYIDETGHVRLPSVSAGTSEANEELASAAVTAVSQWQFEPPLYKGTPVLVLAEQDFDYKPTSP